MPRPVGIVRFRSVIQIVITVILLRLQLAIADCTENQLLNPKNDITAYQIKAISEVLQSFDEQTLRNYLDECFREMKTSEWNLMLTNSTRISISKMTNSYSISVSKIICNFKSSLRINFELLHDDDITFDFNVDYLNSENMWCSVGKLITWSRRFTISIEASHMVNNLSITLPAFERVISFGESALNKVPCNLTRNEKMKIQTELSLTTYQDKILNCRRTTNSEYRSIINKCLHPDAETFNENPQNNYVRLEPYQNMAIFPWITDYNELIVTGLNHFSFLSIDFEQNNTYDLGFKRAEIRWNIASTEQKQYNIKAYDLSIQGSLANLTDLVAVKIGLAYDTTTILDVTLQQKLEKLLASGIGETYKKISHNTSSITHTINEIIRSSKKQTFQKLFEIMQDISQTPSTIFSRTSTDSFQPENITCASENLNISRINIKNITGHVEFAFQEQVNSGFISVDVCMKEAIMHILLKKHPHSAGKSAIITPNPDTTLLPTSMHRPLSQTERISIGEKIYGIFIDTIRTTTYNAAASMFRSILNICESSQNNLERRYFTIIRDYWANATNPFSTWQTDVTIEGSWNFNKINIQYENENVIIDGLRIENVTGKINMEQFFDSNETRTLTYNMSYFSLSINNSYKSIRVQFPAPEAYSIISEKSSNTSLSDQNKDEIFERFQYTVASYIEQSIYNDSNYRTMFRNLVNEVITKGMMDKSPQYDVSTKLVSWLAELVKKMNVDIFPKLVGQRLHLRENAVDVTAELDSLIIQKMETEDTFLMEKLNLTGMIHVHENDLISANISFKIWINRTMDVSDAKYKGKFQLHADLENIRINNSLHKNITSDDHLITELKQLARTYLNTSVDFFDFCKSNFGMLNLTEEYFYLINDTITYSSDYFSNYYIRLHGWQNFVSFHNNYNTSSANDFEIKFTNLTANITWVQNIGPFPSKRSQIMMLEIDEIILTGEILESRNQLIFTNRTHLQLSNKENRQAVERLTKTVVPIILKSIQLSILDAYYGV